MAHGRVGPDIVMTTRYVGMRDVHAVSNHEMKREPDGSSAIDPLRSHLNEILYGPKTQTEAVKMMVDDGVAAPTKQADSPFVQMVLSASPEYFRDDPEDRGSWDDDRLKVWKSKTMDWLLSEYGGDLAHASLHLDEDTPHIHVLIVPTYDRKPRKPGRKRKSETEADFGARKRAAENGKTVRTISRSSNDKWKRTWVRREARVSYHKALDGLGLGYGKDFVGSGDESPDRKETAAWVREQAVKLKADREELEAERSRFRDASQSKIDRIREAMVRVEAQGSLNNEIRRDLDKLGDDLDRKEVALHRVYQGVKRIVGAIAEKIGLPLPKGMSKALEALEDGVKAYRKEVGDPFLFSAEETGEDADPRFGP